MARIPLVSPETLTPEQRHVYDKIVAGQRGKVVGPLRAALHSPELADRWQHLGEFLRYETSLAPRLTELAIVVTARHWNSQVEWLVHAEGAQKAGISKAAIDAILSGKSPEFRDHDEAIVYEYSRHLQNLGYVPDEVYYEAQRRFGTVGVVELTALVGYYTMVAMTLNAHEIQALDGKGHLLTADSRSLSPARRTLSSAEK